jgi:hypothetical protein
MVGSVWSFKRRVALMLLYSALSERTGRPLRKLVYRNQRKGQEEPPAGRIPFLPRRKAGGLLVWIYEEQS